MSEQKETISTPVPSTITDVVQQLKNMIVMNSKLKKLKDLGEKIQQIYDVDQNSGTLEDLLSEYCKDYDIIKLDIEALKKILKQ